MKKDIRILVFFLGTMMYSLSSIGQNNTIVTNTNAVVVELYTSEGCSSCPYADEAMMQLQNEYSKLNLPVYFIALHVDYWDYLGWKDRFSSSLYTTRQREFGRYFSLNSIYTPQTIINGKFEMVGSKKEQIKKYIDIELTKPSSTSLKINTQLNEAKNGLVIHYKLEGKIVDTEIHFMLIEKSANSKVKAGENAGSSLNHINIVQKWEHVTNSNPDKYEFKLGETIDTTKYKLIAFVQSTIDKSLLTATESVID